MRKLSITLLLIGISFIIMKANNYSTNHKTPIYFKKWNEKQRSSVFVPIEATIEENYIKVRFLERLNEPITLQVKDRQGNIMFQDIVTSNEQETYIINLDDFNAGLYELFYIEESIALVGEFQIK